MARTKITPQSGTQKRAFVSRLIKSKSKNETPTNTPKKRRYRPGTRALKEIRFFQKSTVLLKKHIPSLK